MNLPRKTPLRRTALTRTGKHLARRPRVPRPTRNTGPTTKTRQLVRDRSGNACERCSAPRRELDDFHIHHRRPRQMGGTKNPAINSAANLLHLCAACHAWVETHRTEATDAGWLVPAGADPTTWPVLVQPVFGDPIRVYLTTDGDYIPMEDPA